MPQPAYLFFLAHAGADTDRAKELHGLLHPEIPTFLDAHDLVAGEAWDLELPRRQRDSLATVALLSSHLEPAYYLREEIANAIAFQRHDPEKHRLISVHLDGVPTDPTAIPYGVRIGHALDAAKLGIDGVADELRRVAATLDGAPPVSLPVDTPKPADRMALYDALCKLLTAQFDEIVFRVAAPTQHLAPATQPLVRRALDLVEWTEQGGVERMTDLTGAIRKAAPGVLP